MFACSQGLEYADSNPGIPALIVFHWMRTTLLGLLFFAMNYQIHPLIMDSRFDFKKTQHGMKIMIV